MDEQTAGHILFANIAVLSGSVWFYAGWRALQQKPPLAPVPRAQPRWHPVTVVVALTIISYAILSQFFVASHQALENAGEPVREVTLDSVKSSCVVNLAIVVVLGSLLFLPVGNRLKDYGITLTKWPSQLFFGAIGFLASLLPVFIVVAGTLPWRSPETQHPFLKFMRAHPDPSTAAWLILAVVGLAPLAEELQYRVIFQGWLRSLMPARVAIPISAVVFSAVHGFPDALPLMPLALILGYVYDRRGSYLSIVTLHGLFNAWNLIIAFAGSTDSQQPVTSMFHR